VRSGHSRNEAEVFQQREKCRIETSLSPTSVPPYALAHPKLDTVRKLNHLLTHILDFYAIPFGTRYAVYDPVLSLWPFSQIPLHRLRLDFTVFKTLVQPLSLAMKRKKRRNSTWLTAAPSFQAKQRRSSRFIFSELRSLRLIAPDLENQGSARGTAQRALVGLAKIGD